ncbi:MAG: hypothetical protein MJ252_16645 [archaeon]|nr:hypothetical protein [archaeon]
MSYPKVKLTDVLKYLENKEEDNQPLLLVNPKGELITFFRYKGNLKEIYKMEIKITQNAEEKPKIEEEIHAAFEHAFKFGDWLVFDCGCSSSFEIRKFFEQFSFYDKDMFLPDNLQNKEYCLKHNLLRKENDIDNFGNVGLLEINQKSKIIFLTECPEEEFKSLIKLNDINFKPIVIA